VFRGRTLGAERHSKNPKLGQGPVRALVRLSIKLRHHDDRSRSQPPQRNAPGAVIRMGSAPEALMHLSSWMWQYASRATTDYKTTTLSRMHDDVISAILIAVIACLVLAILIMSSPEAAQLTPKQINLLPLWGP